MNYETAASFAQTWGLVYFVAIFLLVLVYALWPRNVNKFRDASQIPFKED